MKKLLIIVLAGCLAAFFVSSAFASEPVPLPPYQIIPPKSELPDEIKAFSGRWEGQWWSTTQHGKSFGVSSILIIEEIPNENQALAIYAWNSDSYWRIKEGWIKATMIFSRDNEEKKVFLSWATFRGGEFEFFLLKNGKIEGKNRKGIYISYITMEKKE